MLRCMDAMRISLVSGGGKMHASVTAACEEAGTDPLSHLRQHVSPEERERGRVDTGGWPGSGTPEQEADAPASAYVRLGDAANVPRSLQLVPVGLGTEAGSGLPNPAALCSAGLNSRCSSHRGPIAAAILGSWAIAADDDLRLACCFSKRSGLQAGAIDSRHGGAGREASGEQVA